MWGNRTTPEKPGERFPRFRAPEAFPHPSSPSRSPHRIARSTEVWADDLIFEERPPVPSRPRAGGAHPTPPDHGRRLPPRPPKRGRMGKALTNVGVRRGSAPPVRSPRATHVAANREHRTPFAPLPPGGRCLWFNPALLGAGGGLQYAYTYLFSSDFKKIFFPKDWV